MRSGFGRLDQWSARTSCVATRWLESSERWASGPRIRRGPRCWDRAAQLVARYRAAQGVEDATSVLGRQPDDLFGKVAWREARRALEQAAGELDDRRARAVTNQGAGRTL